MSSESIRKLVKSTKSFLKDFKLKPKLSYQHVSNFFHYRGSHELARFNPKQDERDRDQET
jgi:hypothetical protein